MNLHRKTQELDKKLEAMSLQGISLTPELVEHLDVLERAVDQIIELIAELPAHVVDSVSNQNSLSEKKSEFVTVDEVPGSGNSANLSPRSDIPVLLVEDNLVNRKLAVLILERIGCSVDVAENGAVGFEKFKSGKYRTIFMDCQMPVMDGYEATRAIRSYEAGASHIPIIAVTANAMKGDREKCLECGMDDYISKPLRPHDLQEAVARWCKVHA